MTQYILVLFRMGPTSYFGPFDTQEDAWHYNVTYLQAKASVELLTLSDELRRRVLR